MSETSDNKTEDKPWLWKKGQSANPKGRPPGVKSLKQFAREYLLSLPDSEKDEFLDALPKELVWKMAEGNPETKQDIKIESNHSFTDEELEIAKQALVKRLNNTTSDRPTQPSSGTETAD